MILWHIRWPFRVPFSLQALTQLPSYLLPVSPIIVTFVGHVSCMTGASAVLPCWAVGIVPITYTWTRGGSETQSPVSPTNDRHIDGESKE